MVPVSVRLVVVLLAPDAALTVRLAAADFEAPKAALP
jgi:hypothetical protein